MYQAITCLTGGIFLPIIWLYIFKAPYHFNRITRLRMQKPFSCGFCLAFWITFFSLWLKTNFIDAIFIGSIAPFMYLYVEDLITNKWEL
jgi:hypothetical protein